MKRLVILLGILFLVGGLIADFNWDQIQNLSNTAGPSHESDICKDGENYYLVWNQWGDINFKKSSNSGANWGNSMMVYSAIDFGGNYPVVAASGDNVYIFYYRSTWNHSEIFMLKSIDGGNSFGEEVQISSAIRDIIVPQIAIDGDNLYLIYEDRDLSWDFNIYLQKSTDAGETWSAAQNISNSSQTSRWANIDVSGDTLVSVWGEQTGSEYDDVDLFSTTSTDGGDTWTTPQNITNNQAYHARLSTRIVGNHIYTASSSNSDGIQSDIILYHSTDLGTTWDDGINVSDNAGNSSRPDLQIIPLENNNRIYLTWSDNTYSENARCQVTVSHDNGNTWSEFESVSQDTEDAIWPKILVTPGEISDEVFAVFDRNEEGTFYSEVWGVHGINSLVDFAHISGTVTSGEGNPLENATVTAGGYFVQTAADGSYNLDVLAGTYDVTASALNYQLNTVYGINAAANETVSLDFTLASQIEGNYPPFNMKAEISGLDNVEISWEEPLGNNAIELLHDDGEAESFNWIGTATGQEYIAVSFSHYESSYLRLIKALYKSDATQNINFSVVADNGGVPDLDYVLAGPYSIEVNETDDNGEWLQIPLDLPLASETLFYIIVGWESDNTFLIGSDESDPSGYSFTTNDNGTIWYTLNDRDFIIRAGIDVESSERDLLGYNVYRDGVQLNSELINEFSFIDTTSNLDESYTYYSTTMYTEGESGPSNSVEVNIAAPILFPPLNLTAEETSEGVTLNWTEPASEGTELFWDNGVNETAVGGESVTLFDVAIRFSVSDLSDYVGDYLAKMNMWIADNDCEVYARVWTGGTQYYAGDLIVDQLVTDLQANSLNEVVYDIPVEIEPDKELWIGYRVINDSGCSPAGCDAGPAIPFKGDMLLYGSDWVSTSQYFGWELNWNIRGLVVEAGRSETTHLNPVALENTIPALAKGEFELKESQTAKTRYDRSITHYNLYRDSELLTEVDSELLSWIDTEVSGGTHEYYLTSAFEDFESTPSNIATIDVTSSDDTNLIGVTSLIGNHPNPFNPSTTISYSLAETQNVELEIYNIKGQLVKTLVNNNQTAGKKSVIWNGKDDNNNPVSSGIYFSRLKTKEKNQTKKMMLLK